MRMLLVLAVLPALVTGGVPSAQMTVPRAAHTATALPSGNVLLAGGCSRDSCELDERGATTELFDLATTRFEPGPSMSVERVSHLAAALPDGSVLVAGGWTKRGLSRTAERYDPDDGAFHAVGQLVTARGAPTATRLRDGRILIVGGTGGAGPLRTAELYLPATRAFEATGSLAAPRQAHTAVRLRDGRVLVVGGSNGGGVLASTELYDPRTGRFTPGPRLGTARHKHAAVTLRNGSVLVLGGSDARDYFGRYATAELLRLGTPRFKPTGTMAVRRFKLGDSVSLLADGRVLVGGGDPLLEVYDPKRGAFRPAGRTGHELAFATTTRLKDGRVLLAGGYDQDLRINRTASIIAPP